MQRTLIYAVWPGSGNGATVEQMEKSRALYRKYMPIFRALAEAGWEPVTLARAEPSLVIVERYGRPQDGAVYLAVHNPGRTAVDARVAMEPQIRPARGAALADMVSGAKLRARRDALALRLDPMQTVVVRVKAPPGT